MSYPKLLYVTANALQVATAPQAANQSFTSGISINITQFSQAPYILVHALNMTASATLASGAFAVYQRIQWQLKLIDCIVTPGSSLTGDVNRNMYGQELDVQFTQPIRIKSGGLVNLFQMDVDCTNGRAFAAADNLFTSVTITYEAPDADGSNTGISTAIVNPNLKSKFHFEKPIQPV
jgi:hypothetical protein